ncbi:hypothetical protein GN956_G5336 [Arapaima gigas]
MVTLATVMRIFTALFVLHFSKSEEVRVEATVTKVVKIGETVILHCDAKHKENTVWFGQRCDEVPFIILSADKELNKNKYFKGYDSRFSTVKQRANDSFSLQIQNISLSDLGLFYCVANFGVAMLIGSRYKLIHAESLISSTSNPPDCVTTYPTTPGPSACPRLSQYWSLALCPVCAALAAVLSCSYICWSNRHKSHTNSQMATFTPKKEDQDENEDRPQEEDQEVTYSTVFFSAHNEGKTRTWN